MLIISDLNDESTLDKAAMSRVSGGAAFAKDTFSPFFGNINASKIDHGIHPLEPEHDFGLSKGKSVTDFTFFDSSQLHKV